MIRARTLTDLEFLVLWTALKEETLPDPLLFVSRANSYDEYMSAISDTKNRLSTTIAPAFKSALELINRPDIRIEIHGWDGRDRRAAAASIRALAVTHGSRGFLVTQLPGETVEHSAGFSVAECPVADLATTALGVLPDTPPGREDDILLPDDDGRANVDYRFGSSIVQNSPTGSVTKRAAKFLQLPAPSVGTIDVIQARSIFGPRGRVSRRLRWRDIQDDGRYVINDANPPTAVAVDRNRFASLLNSRIAAAVRSIRDEQA